MCDSSVFVTEGGRNGYSGQANKRGAKMGGGVLLL